MEQQLLRQADVYPSDPVLAAALGDCHEAYQVLVSRLPEAQVQLEWRYYNDGKAWLGKAAAKKKTVFWLSVWQGFFRVSFFFTEKTRGGIQALPIADELKLRIQNEPARGKLIPLLVDVRRPDHLEDVFALISYKQACN